MRLSQTRRMLPSQHIILQHVTRTELPEVLWSSFLKASALLCTGCVPFCLGWSIILSPSYKTHSWWSLCWSIPSSFHPTEGTVSFSSLLAFCTHLSQGPFNFSDISYLCACLPCYAGSSRSWQPRCSTLMLNLFVHLLNRFLCNWHSAIISQSSTSGWEPHYVTLFLTE